MEDIEFKEIRHRYLMSRCTSAASALVKRGFDARHFSTASEAVNAVLQTIPPGSRVGAGGSVTLREVGIMERLSERGDRAVFHQTGMSPEESLKVRKEAIACPYYLCSSNAITMDGELVNVDGIGNRVAGMVFGPGMVIVMAGANKLTAGREEALSRVKNMAAPQNARRLGIDVPCAKCGYCVDCKSPLSICRVTTIISLKPFWTDLKVFLIAESLGL